MKNAHFIKCASFLLFKISISDVIIKGILQIPIMIVGYKPKPIKLNE